MPEQSSVHAYLNWTKQRIDEMDATLASLEAKGGQVKAESKARAEQMLVEMKQQRDEFQAKATVQVQAGEAATQAAKAQLESQWRGFEARVKTYFETVGKQVEQQQVTFWDVAAAQAQAWHDVSETFHREAVKIAAARRADLETAVKRMKADATEAEARLQKHKQTGSESWAALSAALAESRKAFDRANQKTADALKVVEPAETTSPS